jgi:transposase
MKEITSKNEVIKEQMSLITSIPGIGQNTAWYLIVTTNGFKNFSEWRKLACYAGVAPFEYSSGTSVKGRTKVHSLADKKMKSLLHMCALTTIKNNAELKEYYTRKREEGKPSMLVLNNVKCKLLSRVFAVVKRKQPFVNIFKYAA